MDKALPTLLESYWLLQFKSCKGESVKRNDFRETNAAFSFLGWASFPQPVTRKQSDFRATNAQIWKVPTILTTTYRPYTSGASAYRGLH